MSEFFKRNAKDSEVWCSYSQLSFDCFLVQFRVSGIDAQKLTFSMRSSPKTFSTSVREGPADGKDAALFGSAIGI